jgi:hypothetical protein
VTNLTITHTPTTAHKDTHPNRKDELPNTNGITNNHNHTIQTQPHAEYHHVNHTQPNEHYQSTTHNGHNADSPHSTALPKRRNTTSPRPTSTFNYINNPTARENPKPGVSYTNHSFNASSYISYANSRKTPSISQSKDTLRDLQGLLSGIHLCLYSSLFEFREKKSFGGGDRMKGYHRERSLL